MHFNSLDEFIESGLEDSVVVAGTPADILDTTKVNPMEEAIQVQSSNPQVSSILARLKAAKIARAESIAGDEESITGYSQLNHSSTHLDTYRDAAFPTSTIGNGDVSARSPSSTLEETSRTQDMADYQPRSSVDTLSVARMSMDLGLLPWKPKEKPFARPVADDKLKRSEVAGFFRQRLPAGMRRGPKASVEKLAQQTPRAQPTISNIRETEQLVHAPSFATSRNESTRRSSYFAGDSIDPSPQPNLGLAQSITRSAEITASARRTGSFYGASASDKQSVMTPERQRLMMALNLRRKQLDALKERQDIVRKLPEPNLDDIPYTGKTSNVDSGIDVGDTSGSEDVAPVTRSSPSSRPVQSTFYNYAHSSSRYDTETQTPVRAVDNQVDRYLLASQEVQSTRLSHRGISKTRSTYSVNEGLDKASPRSQRLSRAVQRKSDDGYDSSSSNESLIEEIQDAIVEEATRISIPSSPAIKTGSLTNGSPSPYSITSIVIRTGSGHSRTTSGGNSNLPSYQKPITTTHLSSSPKKANASTNISKRIQALNDVSSGAQANITLRPERSSTMLTLGRRTIQSPDNGPVALFSTSDPAMNSFSHHTSQPDLMHSWRPQSVSVTAHIVRPRTSVSRQESMDLQRSTLQFRQYIPEDGSSMTIPEREKVERPNPVMSPKQVSRRSSFARSSRHSVDISDGLQNIRSSFSKPMSWAEGKASRTSLDHIDEVTDHKKQNRTARMFKRFSSTFGSSAQQSVVEAHEEPEAIRTTSSAPQEVSHKAEMPSMVAIGELDVQFPDSLVSFSDLRPQLRLKRLTCEQLWKRRWVETNGAGRLIISATKVSEVSLQRARLQMTSTNNITENDQCS